MKKIIVLILPILILVGCSNNIKENYATIKSINKTSLNEIADEFANKDFDYFSQIELNYNSFDVHTIEINYYKDGKKIDNLFKFMREKDDQDIPNIQYVYLGYDFYPKQELDETKQSITTSIYLYGPAIKNKYSEEYSIAIECPDNHISYNMTNVKNSIKIEYNEKWYVNPVILNAKVDAIDSMSIKDMIDHGEEIIVLEIS